MTWRVPDAAATQLTSVERAQRRLFVKVASGAERERGGRAALQSSALEERIGKHALVVFTLELDRYAADATQAKV